MAELHWFPFFVSDWLSSRAVIRMTAEQRGAYVHLLALAWADGEVEPSLDASPTELAALSGLGKRWAKLSPLIVAQFEERGGRLYNAKLSEVWHEQQKRHGMAVYNGRKGAAKRAANRKGGSSPAQATLANGLQQSESESERVLVEPTALTSISPPKALGVGTPRPAEMPVDRDVRNAGFGLIRDAIAQAVPPARHRRHA
jgi:uncharacterized protein YdaU (DUF1376 family)